MPRATATTEELLEQAQRISFALEDDEERAEDYRVSDAIYETLKIATGQGDHALIKNWLDEMEDEGDDVDEGFAEALSPKSEKKSKRG